MAGVVRRFHHQSQIWAISSTCGSSNSNSFHGWKERADKGSSSHGSPSHERSGHGSASHGSAGRPSAYRPSFGHGSFGRRSFGHGSVARASFPPSRRIVRRPWERQRGRAAWWSRVEQHIFYSGVDFAEDSEDGGGDDYEFLPESDEEGRVAWLKSIDCDNEFVPETKPHDLIDMDSNDVQPSKEEADGTTVDSDAETEDESILREGKKTTTTDQFTNDLQESSDDHDLDEFKLEWHKKFLSAWTHPTLEKHFKRN